MADFQTYSMPNPIFDQFGYGQFYWELFLSSLVRWLISLPGIVFNAMLLYISVVDSKLRGSCSILLAFGSAFDFAYLLSYSINLLIGLFGMNFIRLQTCYFVQFLPNLGVFSSVWIVFFVGFDRLIAIVFPLWYASYVEQSPQIYIIFMLSITIGYSLFVIGLASQWTIFIYPDLPVGCTNGDIFTPDMLFMLLRNGLLINGASLVCYMFVGIALRRFRQNSGTTTGEATEKHRIFKSLAAIMILVVGTYFGTCAVSLLTASITDRFYKMHVAPAISALLTCTAASSNAPLLFVFSSDYRRAFLKHFGRFWPKCLKNIVADHHHHPTVVPIPMASVATVSPMMARTTPNNTVHPMRAVTPIGGH